MDYVDFLKWLRCAVTPERFELIDETFSVLEILVDAEVYDIAINLGSQLERVDTQSILDALNNDLLTLCDNTLLQYGVRVNRHLLALDTQPTVTKILQVLSLIETYEAKVRILQLIEASDRYEDALVAIAEEVTGDDASDILDLLEDVSPDLIERIIVLCNNTSVGNEQVGEISEPSYASLIRPIISTVGGVVLGYLESGGVIGLPLESYVKMLSGKLSTNNADKLAAEFFGLLLLSGHLNSDAALGKLAELLDRLDIPLAIKMKLSTKIRQLYHTHSGDLDHA